MKQTTLAPITFESDDAFGWEKFADKLERFLPIEQQFVEGSLVVSLNAPFGSGKTHFLKMWQTRMNERRQQDANLPLPILLNAWEDDYCGDPLLALVDGLVSTLAEWPTDPEKKEAVKNLKEALKDVAAFSVGLLNSILSHSTGFDALAAKNHAEAEKEKRNGAGTGPSPDALLGFRHKKTALRNLKTALREVFGKKGLKAIVLVDELDRCRPDFAVQYLETIKHIFDVEGVMFVLAVDLRHLENSAKALFGGQLNFPEYYRKFAHRNVQLPTLEAEGVHKLVTEYIDRFIHCPDYVLHPRFTAIESSTMRSALVGFVTIFNLTPRQIQEVFRIIGHFAAVERPQGYLHPDVVEVVSFLAVLSLVRAEDFQRIANRKISLKELLKVVVGLDPTFKKNERFCFLLSEKFIMRPGRHLETKEAFVAAGLREKDVRNEVFFEECDKFTFDQSPGTGVAEMASLIQHVGQFATETSQ